MDSSTNTEVDLTVDLDSQSTQIFNPSNKISTAKLNNDNFLMWKVQIEFSLEGYNLGNFVNKDHDPPPERIPVSKDSTIMKLDPEYMKWKRQDNFISSWLLGSMSDNIIEQVIHCKTAQEIWNCLFQIFNSRNRAQIMRLKIKLQTIQKDLCL